MELYYAMYQVTSADGTGDGNEVAYVAVNNHPATQNLNIQVNDNLNSAGYFYARFSATPRSNSSLFRPSFAAIQSPLTWHSRD